MTLDKAHPCDTCENERCPIFAKPRYKPTGNTSQYYSIRWVIERVGCASHTSAQPSQQRIEQAIRGLETRAGGLRSDAREFSDYMRSARAAGIEEAIALLRGEQHE